MLFSLLQIFGHVFASACSSYLVHNIIISVSCLQQLCIQNLTMTWTVSSCLGDEMSRIQMLFVTVMRDDVILNRTAFVYVDTMTVVIDPTVCRLLVFEKRLIKQTYKPSSYTTPLHLSSISKISTACEGFSYDLATNSSAITPCDVVQ